MKSVEKQRQSFNRTGKTRRQVCSCGSAAIADYSIIIFFTVHLLGIRRFKKHINLREPTATFNILFVVFCFLKAVVTICGQKYAYSRNSTDYTT
jgi:hypothetical protein